MIEAKRLGYRLQGRHVLRDITLKIPAGSSLAVTGPSGSGKSTLLALLAGLIRPHEGTVLLDGADVTTLEPTVLRQRTGIVFQSYGLLSLLTGAENIELALLARGDSAASIDRQTSRILRDMGLLERSDHLVEELSGGEQQRIAIARALIGNPDVVLADEPTAELDDENRQRVITLLLAVPTSGRTLILATHDDEIATACTRTAQLRDGRLVQPHVPPNSST
jgi:ABC-type lipoprotein export system ATPase subunit